MLNLNLNKIIPVVSFVGIFNCACSNDAVQSGMQSKSYQEPYKYQCVEKVVGNGFSYTGDHKAFNSIKPLFSDMHSKGHTWPIAKFQKIAEDGLLNYFIYRKGYCFMSNLVILKFKQKFTGYESMEYNNDPECGDMGTSVFINQLDMEDKPGYVSAIRRLIPVLIEEPGNVLNTYKIKGAEKVLRNNVISLCDFMRNAVIGNKNLVRLACMYQKVKVMEEKNDPKVVGSVYADIAQDIICNWTFEIIHELENEMKANNALHYFIDEKVNEIINRTEPKYLSIALELNSKNPENAREVYLDMLTGAGFKGYDDFIKEMEKITE